MVISNNHNDERAAHNPGSPGRGGPVHYTALDMTLPIATQQALPACPSCPPQIPAWIAQPQAVGRKALLQPRRTAQADGAGLHREPASARTRLAPPAAAAAEGSSQHLGLEADSTTISFAGKQVQAFALVAPGLPNFPMLAPDASHLAAAECTSLKMLMPAVVQLTLQSGEIGRLANGAVTATQGGTVHLAFELLHQQRARR